RFVLGVREQRGRAPAEARLGPARHARQRVDASRELPHELGGTRACAFHEGAADTAFLLEDGNEQVLRNQLRVTALGREIDGGAQCFLTFGGETIEAHGSWDAANCRARVNL